MESSTVCVQSRSVPGQPGALEAKHLMHIRIHTCSLIRVSMHAGKAHHGEDSLLRERQHVKQYVFHQPFRSEFQGSSGLDFALSLFDCLNNSCIFKLVFLFPTFRFFCLLGPQGFVCFCKMSHYSSVYLDLQLLVVQAPAVCHVHMLHALHTPFHQHLSQ